MNRSCFQNSQICIISEDIINSKLTNRKTSVSHAKYIKDGLQEKYICPEKKTFKWKRIEEKITESFFYSENWGFYFDVSKTRWVLKDH